MVCYHPLGGRVMKKNPWAKAFLDTLPYFSKTPISNLLGAAFLPTAIGSVLVHLGNFDEKLVVESTITFSSLAHCFFSVGIHSGLQRIGYGHSVRTLEFHPMAALKRNLLPCLPLGMILMSLRTKDDIPRLSIRYIGYAVGFSFILDSVGVFFRTLPMTIYKQNFLYSLGTLASLSLLATSEFNINS
jgi:hypothetical protein